ncbi:MAG: diheme cytochrome c [Pseudomonadota bacterium]
MSADPGFGVGRLHLLLLVSVLGVVGAWLMAAPAEMPAQFPMPAGKVYVNECGSCHTAFAPGLLPARSWRRMMAELEDHFGEDASLDEPQYFAILKELETLASDGSYADMRMRRISAALPEDAEPQRITGTSYFKKLHGQVSEAVWKRKKIQAPSNCVACHLQANKGRFAELEIRVPPAP